MAIPDQGTMNMEGLVVTKEGKPAARQYLKRIKFAWQGREEGEWASEKIITEQVDTYLQKPGVELGFTTKEVLNEMLAAQKIAEESFDELGLKDVVDDPNDPSVLLPYHGKDHAWNTLVGGIKAFLPKLNRIAKERGYTQEQKRYWLKVATRVLASHEIDDWWVPAIASSIKEQEAHSAQTDPRRVTIESVKGKIKQDLLDNGIDPADFDDFIRLDNFVLPVSTMMVDVAKGHKSFIATEGEATQTGQKRKIFTDASMIEALGDTIAGADFMQTLNTSYQLPKNLIYGFDKFSVMIGPLTLALEFYTEKPNYLPKTWYDELPGGVRRLNYKKIGVDREFLEKIREKCKANWKDLAEFDRQEMLNAVERFEVLVKLVQQQERETPKT